MRSRRATLYYSVQQDSTLRANLKPTPRHGGLGEPTLPCTYGKE